MAQIKRSQLRTIEELMAHPNGFGYVLDFSDRTILEFFEDEFGIDFAEPKYSANGSSKRNRLSTFIELEDPYIVAKVLRALWDRRETLLRNAGGGVLSDKEKKNQQEFLEIIASVESDANAPRADALDYYAKDRTLGELISDIERDLQAEKPEAAMDHLHTYCMKKFAHLLEIRGVACDEGEALHARFGKYRKELLEERELSEFTDRALKSAISLFESFNHIRNNRSFAHDNRILEPAEARYVFDNISAILIFLRAVEAGRYEP